MSEWTLAQTDPAEELAQLHFFSLKKRLPEGAVEFTITVREYATPQAGRGHFFAQADKQTNQKTAPFTPCGWGGTLLKALSECVQAVHRFPFENSEQH